MNPIKFLLISVIRFYQKFLSKHKGFTCAHLAHKGGVSCSTAVASIINTKPMSQWAKLSKQRLKSCRIAHEDDEKHRRRSKDRGCGDLGGCCPHHCDDVFGSFDL